MNTSDKMARALVDLQRMVATLNDSAQAVAPADLKQWQETIERKLRHRFTGIDSLNHVGTFRVNATVAHLRADALIKAINRLS